MQSALETLNAKAEQLQQLHEQSGIFVIPNAWDAGSAKILESLGFKAIATTSAGAAFVMGKPDGERAMSRDENLKNARNIVAATHLPVSADLENGYGDDPAICAETILLAAQSGLCGASIEDATGIAADPIYSFEYAVERVRAAVSAAKSLPYPFMLTARAENFINGRPDLPDTLKRLEAFAAAGADVLFAPGLKTREEITAAVKAVSPLPLNVIMGIAGADHTLADLEQMGVKRVSLGSSLIRAAYSVLFRAMEEISSKGSFTFQKNAVSYADFNKLFRG